MSSEPVQSPDPSADLWNADPGDALPKPPPASAPVVLDAQNIAKIYRLYARPFDRLKEAVLGRRKSYHQLVHAMHPASFQVRAGECVGVVGPNGAGKTTLLSLLAGILTPSQGSIAVTGRVSAILGLGIGMIPENTGRQNIRHGLITRGIHPDLFEEKTRQIIEFSELAESIDHEVRTYSSGMAMRLAFSLAHAVDPDILIVDEALAVGDARFVFKCQRKMREFIDQGKTLFFVSHSAEMISMICTRALLMDKGRILSDGNPRDILYQYHAMLVGSQTLVRGTTGAAGSEPANRTEIDKNASSTAIIEDTTSLSAESAPPAEPAGGFGIKPSVPPVSSGITAPSISANWGAESGLSTLRLLSVQVLNAPAVGDKTWEMCQGDQLRLRLTMQTDQPIAQPALGCILKSGYRHRISGATTTGCNIPLEPIAPGEFTFDFVADLFLQAGTYIVEVIVADLSTDPYTLLHSWEEAANLMVRWADYRLQGYCDMGAAIQFRGRQYSVRDERDRRLKLSATKHVSPPEPSA